jgi:hypothetical protein
MSKTFGILFILSALACQNYKSEPAKENKQPEFLSHARKNVLAADILLHHQIQKMSLIVKQTTSPIVIDSFFNFISTSQEYDSICFQPGLFNRFGEIRLFSDSLGGSQLGTINFVLDGKCNGFYVEFNKQLRRYSSTLDGRKYLKALDSMYYKRLH